MKPLPIRVKFALWSGLAMSLALGTLAIGTLFNLSQKQTREADREIAIEFGELEALLPGKLPETVQWTLDPNLSWTVFNDRGQMLRQDSALVEEAALPALSASGIIATKAGERSWRVKGFKTGPNRTIVVGYDMDKARIARINLIVAYAWSLPLVIVVAVGASWWVTGRALAPFRDLTNAVEGIQPTHLERQQRVTVHPAKDEIQRLTISFNALLARIENSITQTKRFAADASHELRTPLTIMKSEVERMIAQPDIPEETADALVSLQDEIARLDRITEQLLQLAQFDAGQIVLDKSLVNYSELLAEACDDAELIASSTNVKLEVSIEPDLKGYGNPIHLRRLFLNLLDNACKYNRPNGRIRCALDRGTRTAILRIGNTGPGIPVEMRDRVFERFFRADASRTHDGGHGLGLALSWEIAELHGGCLSLRNNCGSDWTEFEVTLPMV